MSFFSDKDREACWTYFDRHLGEIPHEPNRLKARAYLLEREENVELSTVGSYLTHIKAFGIYLGSRDWRDASRDDVIIHIKEARGKQGRCGRRHPRRDEPLGQYTKYQRMVMLREFYKWLLDTEDTPPQFRRMPFIKPTMEEQSLSHEPQVTQDEVMDLLAASSHPMDRAVVMGFVDTGFRAGEMAALNIGDLTFDDHGVKIMHSREARGLKTHRRKVATRATFATQYLRAWVEVHPRRLHAEAPLYISRSNRNFGERLGAAGMWGIVDRLCRKARVRHIHPHMFRHMAARLRALDGWNEEMMRLHFGWAKGSDMPSLYSGVDGEEYDRFALRRAGVPLPKPKPAWVVECASCYAESPPDAVFCMKCGAAFHRGDPDA